MQEFEIIFYDKSKSGVKHIKGNVFLCSWQKSHTYKWICKENAENT